MVGDLLSWPSTSAVAYSTSFQVPWFTPSRPSVREPSLNGRLTCLPGPGRNWARCFSIVHCPCLHHSNSLSSGAGTQRETGSPLPPSPPLPQSSAVFSPVFQACCCGVSPEAFSIDEFHRGNQPLSSNLSPASRQQRHVRDASPSRENPQDSSPFYSSTGSPGQEQVAAGRCPLPIARESSVSLPV
jgi:hypothetical protein